MENNSVETTMLAAGEDGLQFSQEAEVAAGGGTRMENGGSAVSEHEGMATAVSSGGGGGSDFGAKRKRGRPRKLSGEMVRQEFMAMAELPASLPKRGRGRPKGTGKWQAMAASFGMGGYEDTAGSNFTPHFIFIQQGENIVDKIWSFSQMTTDSLCILSAAGTISTAELFILASRDGVLRFEGQFCIVSLNGSHTYDPKRPGGKICRLSVQLAYPDNRLCGGAVAGPLIAAGPTQLTVATFKQNFRQLQSAVPRYLGSPPPSYSNSTVAATPGQVDNGRLSDGEVRVAAATAQRAIEGSLNGSNAINSASVQPVDWSSMQQSASGSGI